MVNQMGDATTARKRFMLFILFVFSICAFYEEIMRCAWEQIFLKHAFVLKQRFYTPKQEVNTSPTGTGTADIPDGGCVACNPHGGEISGSANELCDRSWQHLL
jgi:hypothetical protein